MFSSFSVRQILETTTQAKCKILFCLDFGPSTVLTFHENEPYFKAFAKVFQSCSKNLQTRRFAFFRHAKVTASEACVKFFTFCNNKPELIFFYFYFCRSWSIERVFENESGYNWIL